MALGVGLALGLFASLVFGPLRFPEAPLWVQIVAGVGGGAVGAALLERFFVARLRGVQIARLGSYEQRSAWVRRSAATPENVAAAAAAIEIGELACAASIIASFTRLSRMQPLPALVAARYDLAAGDPGTKARALDTLMRWTRFGVGPIATEVRRYRAFILASTLVVEAGSAPTPRARAAAMTLLGDRDVEVRAYGAWLTVGRADAIATTDTAAIHLGAAFARAAGFPGEAASLEAAAASRAAQGLSGPYRG
jgi:hypothetical protein